VIYLINLITVVVVAAVAAAVDDDDDWNDVLPPHVHYNYSYPIESVVVVDVAAAVLVMSSRLFCVLNHYLPSNGS